MSDHTYKDIFGDGYTTYHDDGTKSHTTKDIFGDGYTTYHEDGSKSHTTKDLFGDGTTTYNADGSKSYTSHDIFGDGYTTYHEDGSKSYTSQDVFGGGYTTYHEGGYSSSYGTGSYGQTSPVYTGYAAGAVGGYNSIVRKASAFDIIITILGAILIGLMVRFYSSGLPTVQLACLAVVIAFGIKQRDKKVEEIQSVWFNWSMALATIVGFYIIQNKTAPPDNTPYAILFHLIPLAYIAVSTFVCRQANFAQDDIPILFICAFLMTASWFLTIYKGYNGYESLFRIGQDALFIGILLLAIFNLILALLRCRISIFAFVFVCICVYITAKDMTGFEGFYFIKDLIMTR